MEKDNREWFLHGMKNGIPICLGYFAVAITMGITAKAVGLTAFQATINSATVNASAGQFAGYTVMASGGTYIEMAIMTLIANARYLLMSASLSQKLDPGVPMLHRMIIGFDVTDEIFGVCVSVPGKLNPYFAFGVMIVAAPGWWVGTCCGVIIGNILTPALVSAMGVALYGMFIAVIIPPARKHKIVAGVVIISFAVSYAFNRLAIFDFISSGTKIIILTIVIALGAAILFPVKDKQEVADEV